MAENRIGGNSRKLATEAVVSFYGVAVGVIAMLLRAADTAVRGILPIALPIWVFVSS